MHGSLSPRRPEVVTEASAFGRGFVAPDFADTALAEMRPSTGASLTPKGRPTLKDEVTFAAGCALPNAD
jgi:hypothetical protein